jgi:3-hydroxyisobutyrate dehydrogenase-like beta-hydroxyacid dehydrogenase
MANLGLIGVGLMGHGIAANLLKHGHALTLLDHPGNQPTADLVAAGARLATTPAAVAQAADTVILVVTGSPQVEAVLLGEGGVLQGLRPGSLVIDCSTAIPSSTERMAAAVLAAGSRFLDAPMTRTPKEAAEGRLNLLVGGEADLLAACRPVLACFAENITHCGGVGTGHRMKLLHNYVSLGTIALISEAAACATRGGVDPGVFVDVLAKGGGGGVALERVKPFLTTGDTSALRFAMSNALKDISYYSTMAADADAARQIAEGVQRTLADALEAAGPQALAVELSRVLATRS